MPLYTPEREFVYDVKRYGALGDGVTDDTVPIQAAINAANTAGGGIVELPTGTYLTDPNPGIQVKSNVTLRGMGYGSVIKLRNGSTRNDNIIKAESQANISIHDLRIEGNRTNQAGSPGAYTYTQYGLYIADSTGFAYNLWINSTTGVGFHTYNCGNGFQAHEIVSDDHNYHSFEVEQCVGSNYSHLYTQGSLRHALLVSPGEVGGTGSKYNTFTGCHFGGSDQYGIALDAAVGDVSAWLSEGNVFTNCTVTGNGQYGISTYKQDKQVFNNCVVAENGYFGIYLFQSQKNLFNNLFMHNNSQATNNAYDEIMLEGYSANNAHPSTGNIFNGALILIDGTNKARYAIQEATANDGNNTFITVDVPNAGATGRYNVQSNASILTSRTLGVSIAAGATLNGNQMGIDAPFGTAALRFYNSHAGGNLQFVAPNGNADWYLGGNNTFSATPTRAIAQNKFKIATPETPASATASGETGDIAWDSNFVYVCVANNTWKRAAISTW